MKKSAIIMLVLFFIFVSFSLIANAQTDVTQKASNLTDEGIDFIDAGKYDDAIKKFEEAVKTDPNYAYANFSLGACYYDLEKMEQAIPYYEQAIKTCLDNKDTSQMNVAYAICDMGLCYRRQGNLDKAIECYEKAITYDDKDSITYNNLAAAYYNKGEYQKTIDASQNAIKYDSKDTIKPHSYYWIGMSYMKLNDYKQSIANFNEYLKIAPDAPDIEEINGYIKEMEGK